jgi:hypothetical protein
MFRNEMTRKKSSLMMIDDPMQDGSQPLCDQPSKNFGVAVDQRYGAPILERCQIAFLGKEPHPKLLPRLRESTIAECIIVDGGGQSTGGGVLKE